MNLHPPPLINQSYTLKQSTLHPRSYTYTLKPAPSDLSPKLAPEGEGLLARGNSQSQQSTLHPTTHTLNPEPTTLHPQPSALSPNSSRSPIYPQTYHQPYTLNEVNNQPYTLKRAPSTLKTCTLNPGAAKGDGLLARGTLHPETYNQPYSLNQPTLKPINPTP